MSDKKRAYILACDTGIIGVSTDSDLANEMSGFFFGPITITEVPFWETIDDLPERYQKTLRSRRKEELSDFEKNSIIEALLENLDPVIRDKINVDDLKKKKKNG